MTEKERDRQVKKKKLGHQTYKYSEWVTDGQTR